MIFANLCQRCEQARRQSIKTLLLILLSFGVLSASNDNVQADQQVGQAPSDPRAKVIRLTPEQTHPNQRVALVIGNGAYHKDPLLNTPNDSDDMAMVLKQVGFEVMLLKDASLKKMKKAIQQFGEKLKKGGVGLFYFAGHGVQYQGENYLFPIGAMRSVTVAEHLPYETLRVGYLLATMEGARNNLNIVILDACRNNPFARSLFRGRNVKSRKGLALISVPSGTLIAYATRPNKTALDGTGRNSPYVKYLQRELPKPGLSILKVLTNVRAAVKKETNNRQAPGFYSELDEEFCFVGTCGQNTPSQPVTVPVSEATLLSKSDIDGDGVADSLDKCPDNTSAEISAGVDSRGCPLDKDQDGVADYRDSCLGTSAGVSVKPNGCPVPKTTVSTPSSYRYTDNGDGTVTDNRTGLIWMKKANCFGRQKWETAMQRAAKLAQGQCGLRDGSRKGDWRLPTKKEWQAMVDKRYKYPALSNAAGTGQWKEGDAFSGVQYWYWSSTSKSMSSAWNVSLYFGYVQGYNKTYSNDVWAVRGGH